MIVFKHVESRRVGEDHMVKVSDISVASTHQFLIEDVSQVLKEK